MSNFLLLRMHRYRRSSLQKRACIIQRGVQQLLRVCEQHDLDTGDGFRPSFNGLLCCDEPQLSGDTACFLLLYDTVF